MSLTWLSQLYQVGASSAYDDAVSSVHTAGVAEVQTTLEGDLNVLRSLMKDVVGNTNWYDDPTMNLKEISDKYFIQQIHLPAFENVTLVTGGTSVAFDTAIKTIAYHNDGAGSSTAQGAVVDATKPYVLIVRDHATQDPIDDGNNNEVYGRLSWNGTTYVVTWYSYVSGTETAYSFTTTPSVDLAYVLTSRRYQDLAWDIFANDGYHDVSGVVGTVSDDNIIVDNMSYLLSGLTTQAQVNTKLDKLGHVDTDGEGASYVAIDDSVTGSNGYFTGGDVQAALEELKSQLGGASSVAYNFSEDNVLADNDAVYAALNKLDLKWGDLASVSVGEGASLVGVYDVGGYYTGTNVESVLQEIGQQIQDVSGLDRRDTTTSLTYDSGDSMTVPGSLSYTPGVVAGENMYVYFNGVLMRGGASGVTTHDYQEAASGPATSIVWNRTIPSGSNVAVIIRK